MSFKGRFWFWDVVRFCEILCFNLEFKIDVRMEQTGENCWEEWEYHIICFKIGSFPTQDNFKYINWSIFNFFFFLKVYEIHVTFEGSSTFFKPKIKTFGSFTNIRVFLFFIFYLKFKYIIKTFKSSRVFLKTKY